MPKTKNILRPSAHDQAVLCVGSVQAQEPYGWQTSPPAERGKRSHDATALILQTGEKGIVKVKSNGLITDDDFAQIEECIKKAKELMPDDPDVITFVEVKFDLKRLGLTGGKADLMYLSPKYKAAVVIDWKFGAGPVPDPEENRQMLDYSIGAKDLALKLHGIELESVEAYIIQPGSWKEDDKFRDHTWSATELDSLVPMVISEAMAVQAKDPLRTAGYDQCKFCNAKPDCKEYKAWKELQDQAKETAHKSEMATVTVGTGVMVVSEEDLKSPVNLISQETIQKAENRLELAKSIKVTDPATANTAGTLSKDIRKLISLVDERRKDIKAPFFNFGKKIDAEAKKALDPLRAAAEVLDGQVTAFIQFEKAREDKIKAEQEAKRRAAEEKIRQAQEAEASKQREAEEAVRRAAEAEDRAANLKTKAARDKALAKAAEERAKAEEAQRLANEEEEKRLRAERDARAAESEMIQAAPSKIAGYRGKEEVTWDLPDYSKIPAKYLETVLVPNEKAIDLLIKQGKISEEKCKEWITITRETVAARSR